MSPISTILFILNSELNRTTLTSSWSLSPTFQTSAVICTSVPHEAVEGKLISSRTTKLSSLVMSMSCESLSQTSVLEALSTSPLAHT